ncbi:hypothetical protein CONPUDRAFT_93157 [Coniophora puteana RWD-64-598 SS2]|uniref:Peptidase M20 domain-containing protein 2 n=1 Tax=Coniophora puteana (strain RWD-64-598) TaxID=741705 RepID=A0A5M3M9F8_CONPW|nr:uncharacterized protein CONPUDRAFT_93157 [Coniophora puteana RWD-64-598 SS2]EIW75878.1 hypothetical protein CONPUDRAFT_93157 [Coniophora puteana RWD-64-598 SS2]
MRNQGWDVRDVDGLPTAWIASFECGNGGRTLGVNSEMDALPDIGHACGHNLIGVAGVAIACAVRAAMEQMSIPGKVVLLGTPAEEGGLGKLRMLEKGLYEGMDACVMVHPAPGPIHSVSLSGSLAAVVYEVTYKGHPQNALDAAVLAYNAIAVLRQQTKPTHRIHGVFGGKWTGNIIPDNAALTWVIRAPTIAEARESGIRVRACFEAAATATGCKVTIGDPQEVYELRQNSALGEELRDVVRKRYGDIDYEWGISSASTDFVNLPSLHPGYSIPTIPDGGNHTLGFTDAAKTKVTHDATMVVSKALAAVGTRVLVDEEFAQKVKDAFEEDKKRRGT